ncbi:hypothetical protein CHS0354_019093, partial [Potamilus streckersoni]
EDDITTPLDKRTETQQKTTDEIAAVKKSINEGKITDLTDIRGDIAKITEKIDKIDITHLVEQ